jgi:uncharacterized protein
MSEDLRGYVDEQPLYDVHEHHMPEILGDRDVGLAKLFGQSYAAWTQARPYRVGPEPEEAPLEFDLAWYVERSGSNAFVRTLCSALEELYGMEVTRESSKALDAEIRRRHRDPDWPAEVMRRARVEHVITDPYSDPLLDARSALGPLYSSVARVNALALAWHPDVRDHNGNCRLEFARRLGADLSSFDAYTAFLERFVDTLGERGQVALKNALAYDRDLCFDEPDESLARRAWGALDPSPAERKAFGDFVVDRLCTLAGERGVPVQMHLGTALIRGSHPLNAAGLIERHPRTRFLLMHFAYPWSRDLLGMAFTYRNVWLDFTWSFMLSPSHARLALHEAIEILPDESRLMFGGDSWHPEESYGALALGRRVVSDVLQEKLDAGYLDAAGAQRLARRILHENAREFFAA